MVVEELRKNKPIGPVARRYSLSLDQVREIAEEEGISVKKPARLVEGVEALVPARLRPFIVAIKTVLDDWPSTPAVEKARHDYDAGLVETSVGRIRRKGQEDLLVFYSFPRKYPIQRAPYFGTRSVG